ncbi:MAG: cbb3-type cytochrome oxidase assembly protein CcoS [Caulobacteraceae bacterium]
MTILAFVVPFTLLLAVFSLGAFWWTFRHRQYDDPKGDSERILLDHMDDGPAD